MMTEYDKEAIQRVADFLGNLSLAQDRVAVVTTRNGTFELMRDDLETIVLLATQETTP